MRSLRGGFTLVELLVVIAVIAVLISVLLPAVGHARVAARQSAVLAALRDMGVGNVAYMNDYKDALPVLEEYEEKPVLSLSVMAKVNGIARQAFVNPNTLDTPATAETDDGRPVLADVDGMEITHDTAIDGSNVGRVAFHCSYSYDNEAKPHAVWKPIVYMGDRADYERGRTMSANWGGKGMCLLWTDQHAAFSKSRAMKDQSDPNVFHHNEFGGEGSKESREGVSVTEWTLDTHMRFFSEEEDDGLLTDGE